MKKGVLRPGHVQIRVMDMQQALKHYVELLGLIKTHQDSQGRVYLKGWTEVERFSVVLVPAAVPGMDFMGFKVIDDQTLSRLALDLAAFGCQVEHIPAGELDFCGRRVRFLAPTGHWIELYAEKEYTGRWGVSETNPEAWPRGLRGMRAMSFDHCQLHGSNLPLTRELFVDVLGFHLSEQVLDANGNSVADWLSISIKAHDIAFVGDGNDGAFHHAGFLLETWETLLRAGDLLTMTDTSLDVGPTRHGITHGQSMYFFDPSGNRNEVFAGGDFHYPDQKPVTWHEKDLGKAIFYHSRMLNERFLTVMT
ncbi:catechol 2,3-dioxygenase [Pseudomonas sp. GCM10022188]|uniref:catechol 2,3-dioxygenase n=1 Tax=Pseudomonas TaxID=286 RepID=UPI001E4A5463|nr:catechol 2,3-dioxygenase [Pseudomonas oryzagri]MCC6073954.1 catechol 2,3-dioxygenase [Pseudomonas oryzagri]